jgi:hypothetical protein
LSWEVLAWIESIVTMFLACRTQHSEITCSNYLSVTAPSSTSVPSTTSRPKAPVPCPEEAFSLLDNNSNSSSRSARLEALSPASLSISFAIVQQPQQHVHTTTTTRRLQHLLQCSTTTKRTHEEMTMAAADPPVTSGARRHIRRAPPEENE